MFTKRIFFLIPLALTACHPGTFQYPHFVNLNDSVHTETYYAESSYENLSAEISYYERMLQRENKRCYSNSPHSHREMERIQQHLKNLYLRRSEMEYFSRCLH